MKKVFRLVFGFVSTSVVLATASSSFAGESPKSGGTFVYPLLSDVLGLDPGLITDLTSSNVLQNIYENLVRFKKGTTEIESALAENWTVSADMHEYIFKLRQGIKFHDNTPMNADAVIFSLMRQHDPKHEAYAWGTPWQYWNDMGMASLVKSIDKVDDLTVRFSLTRPEATFLANLAMVFAEIVSPTAVRKYKKDFIKHPVGTGPFVFEKWQAKESVTLKANKAYWDQKAYLEKVIFKVYPSADAVIKAFINREISIVDTSRTADLKRIAQKRPDAVLQKFTPMSIWYLAMNNQVAPFKDIAVRQALNIGFDKNEAVTQVWGDLALPAINPIPPSMWSFNETVKPWPFDVTKAKEMLSKAGVPPKLKIELIMSEKASTAVALSSHIVKDFSKLGIEVVVKKLPRKQYYKQADDGDFQMALINWVGDNGDPDNFLNQLLSGTNSITPASNAARYNNKKVNELLALAKAIPVQTQREKLYREAQVIIHEEAPWIPIAHFQAVYVTDPSIKGLIPSPLYFLDLSTVWKTH